ncbi:type III secretion protein [Pseudomonas sp. S35]|nr:type III secretion protein [Pseudomonas sp. S35]
MNLRSLALPPIDGTTVCALTRLGRGLFLPYCVADQRGELRLEPGAAPQVGSALCFETACGVLALGDPGPVLNLLGECPVTLAEHCNDPASWFWALFQDQLSPQVQSLFSYLRLVEAAQPLTFGCRLTVTLGDARAVSHLALAPETFLALHAAGAWQPLAHSLPNSFRLSLPMILGRLKLPVSQVCNLRPGDVVLMDCPAFNTEGDGVLSLGRYRLEGRLDVDREALRLTLFSIKETDVDEVFVEPNDSYEWCEPEQTADETSADVFGHEPFDELAMSLSVRCGALLLSLGELRQLAPGAVLGVTGYAPGMAGLYYGDRPIGQGQLVDVNGRLGLQLSRVIFSR